MLTGSTEFQELLMRKELNMADRRFNRLIKNFHFRQVLNSDDSNNVISNQIIQSENIVVDIYEESSNKYFIICFNENIHIIDQSNQAYVNKYLTDDCIDKLFILNDAKDNFIKISNIQRDKIAKNQEKIDILEDEISNITQYFNLCGLYKPTIINIWKIIRRCVTGYLIRKGYSNSVRNKEKSYIPDIERPLYITKIFKEDEFVILRAIGKGDACESMLAYHIESEHLYCIKTSNSAKRQKNLEREILNYQKLYNPLICFFYGITMFNDRRSLVIEFIDGKTLDSLIKDISIAVKYQIIYQILLVINYLHYIHFIYRDLKPNNILFSRYHAILIDFDQMIELDRKDINSTEDFTRDFTPFFHAPEIYEGNYKPSYKTDVYSIGMMIYYILMETNDIDQLKLDAFKEKYPSHYDIFLKCTEKDQEKRPSVNRLLFEFGNYIYSSPKELISQDDTEESNLKFKSINYFFLTINNTFTYNTLAHYFNDIVSQNKLGKMFYEGDFYKKDINRSIYYTSLAANQNHPAALFNLGITYLDYNINKALHYLVLSANLQYVEAQFHLGLIYFLGQYVPINIEKAIYYFELAAKQDYPDALNNLGNIYLFQKNKEKAIYYYSLAANLKDLNAYNNLGAIYSDENYEGFDINKAISYYQFAADHDITASIFELGMIYYKGKYVEQNAKKAIYYLTKGAVKNDIRSLLNLGNIYFQGEIIPVDIEKAIKYFTLAADQNNPDAQYNLGFIYSTDRYIKHDSEKAIKYYTLAANQNYSMAQFNLGLVYYKGIIVPKSIENALKFIKLAAENNLPNAQYFLCRYYASGVDTVPNYKIAFHYLTLASNQGFPEAQYDLGYLYYEAKHVPRDMKKAIDLMTKAAKQNYARAQYDLGVIYIEGKYIKRDAKKAIDYFILASKQNHMKAHINLGILYSDGLYTPIDADKAIYHLTKAADQNNPEALFYLGKIYFSPECKVYDIKKAIHYMELAAEKNYADAQNFLGALYMDDKFGYKDIKKAIHYLTISSDRNCVVAQKNLGFFYLNKKNNEYDIEKAIHYLSLAAENNFPDAQGALGIIYFEGAGVPKDVQKALKYLHLSVQNHFHLSQRILGDLYLEGNHVGRDISKSIHYYIEAILYNDERAKNNLAVIYKNGYGGIEKNIGLAKEYFEEAIQKKCVISMFNLAKVCYFEEEEKGIKVHNKSIQLLLNSAYYKLDLSITFLFIILIKRFKIINSIIIEKELKKAKIESQQLANSLYEKYLFLSPLLYNEETFENAYKFIQAYDLVFINGNVAYYNQFEIDKKKEPTEQVKQLIKLGDDFYEGFGNDFLM